MCKCCVIACYQFLNSLQLEDVLSCNEEVLNEVSYCYFFYFFLLAYCFPFSSDWFIKNKTGVRVVAAPLSPISWVCVAAHPRKARRFLGE